MLQGNYPETQVPPVGKPDPLPKVSATPAARGPLAPRVTPTSTPLRWLACSLIGTKTQPQH